MGLTAHWLLWTDDTPDDWPSWATIVWDAELAEAARDLGRRVEGPFTDHRGAVDELEALREAVRGYLNGAPLDEHGRFKDPAREVLYRAAGGR